MLNPKLISAFRKNINEKKTRKSLNPADDSTNKADEELDENDDVEGVDDEQD